MSKSFTSWLRDLSRATRPTHLTRRTQPAGTFRPRLEPLEARLAPAAYTVDALTDTGAGSGLAGDLRYCIKQANQNPGPDTISFDATVFGAQRTIDLRSGALVLEDTSGATTISGPAAGVIVSGGNATGIVQVNSGVTASLGCLTVADGNSAGTFGG